MTDLEREALRKKRGLSELSQKQKQILSDYLQNSPYKRIDKDLENEGGFYGAKADDFGAMLEGRGKFRGSDRYASNLGESLDSVFGAPARTSIDRLQEGNIKAALVDAMAQVGRDPEEAPTGVDIASKVTDNPYLGAGLATAVDLGAQVPMPFSPGVVGKVKSIVPEAEAILSKIKTPEQAVALKGAEREQYLKALDEVYGDSAKRASEQTPIAGLFHGTPKLSRTGFDRFRLSKAGKNGEYYGRGVYTTPDASEASIYTDILDQHSGVPIEEASGAVYGLRGRMNNPLDLNTLDGAFQKKVASWGVSDDAKKRILAAKNNNEIFGVLRGEIHPDQITKSLKQLGYDGISTTEGHQVFFDPNQIRSVNAAFDPRFKDSDLLLAGKAGVNPSDLPSPLISAIRQKREEKNRNK